MAHVARALASDGCGLGSIPGHGVTCRLSCCWFSSLLRGFLSGSSGFPPSKKTNTPNHVQLGLNACLPSKRILELFGVTWIKKLPFTIFAP